MVQRRPPAVVVQLACWFRRNGYVRWQDEERLTEVGLGYQVYKKGHEVRLVANSRLNSLALAGLNADFNSKEGKAFLGSFRIVEARQ